MRVIIYILFATVVVLYSLFFEFSYLWLKDPNTANMLRFYEVISLFVAIFLFFKLQHSVKLFFAILFLIVVPLFLGFAITDNYVASFIWLGAPPITFALAHSIRAKAARR